jgi:hypothetical protein
MEMCPVGAELFHAKRRTDKQTDGHEEAIVSFRNFAKAPKNERIQNLLLEKNTENVPSELKGCIGNCYQRFPLINRSAWEMD